MPGILHSASSRSRTRFKAVPASAKLPERILLLMFSDIAVFPFLWLETSDHALLDQQRMSSAARLEWQNWWSECICVSDAQALRFQYCECVLEAESDNFAFW